ncbi:MAG: hypothetical protein JKX97_08940, partial [Candidatus Lindowbacteria bacterium]|nr:hypothetical protein [Candidatus Lindowbacteria bacterium]
LISDYLRKFGWEKVTIERLHDILASAGLGSILHVPTDLLEEDNDSGREAFYTLEVTCPFCSYGSSGDIQTAKLRTRSLVLEYNYKSRYYPLLVPSASRAFAGYRFEDPLLRQATVCPHCFFSSIKAEHFNRQDGKGQAGMFFDKLPQKKYVALREEMQRDEKNRRAVTERFEDVPAKAWNARRSPSLGRAALVLAATSLEIMAQYDRNLWYPAASAYLSGARISHDLSQFEHEVHCLRAARENLRKTLEIDSTLALPVYQMIVISWNLGDMQEATKWLDMYDKHKSKLKDGGKYFCYISNLSADMRVWDDYESAAG